MNTYIYILTWHMSTMTARNAFSLYIHHSYIHIYIHTKHVDEFVILSRIELALRMQLIVTTVLMLPAAYWSVDHRCIF